MIKAPPETGKAVLKEATQTAKTGIMATRKTVERGQRSSQEMKLCTSLEWKREKLRMEEREIHLLTNSKSLV